jgi:hypothetical protein
MTSLLEHFADFVDYCCRSKHRITTILIYELLIMAAIHFLACIFVDQYSIAHSSVKEPMPDFRYNIIRPASTVTMLLLLGLATLLRSCQVFIRILVL